MRIVMVAAVALLAVPATAQTTAPVGPAQKVKPKKEKKICRTLEAMSYTRMPRSVCKTKEEWDHNGADTSVEPGVRSTDGSNVPSH